ncbi:hypothetical protein BS333_08550 [Vibrio azureus]|uniref:Uncharacterized protein n=1 Tax=Vibrio azureus NBRC 104587 TaxID=1219077 RepID=U3CH16_9VIBR|nr:hypothetical protein [Vibrio azureus]AUI86433.1 hypothetical protein BS333_08550 [Vibrio azureus]GAD77558.1 hypothetical protein VAZ01S_080_00080 [Vibrio azureus NBRC 104587]
MNINNLLNTHIKYESLDNASLSKLSTLDSEKFDNASHQLEQIEKSIALLGQEPTASMLAMITKHQQQLVLSVVGSINSEFAIAQMLADGIESLGKMAEDLEEACSGASAFQDAIWDMFNAMKDGTLSGVDYEDMYQLALMDVLSHAEEYGLDGDPQLLKDIGNLLEKIGSGSHNTYNFDPSQLGDIVSRTWSAISNGITSGSIPSDSLAYKAMQKICGSDPITGTVPNTFMNQFKPEIYRNPDLGGWITDDLDNISPMLRIVILTNLLSNPEYSVSSEQLRAILTGDISSVNSVIDSVTKSDFNSATDYLFDDGSWKNQNGGNMPSGVSDAVDYQGTISIDYLNKLYEQFPTRPLTDDEVKKLQNISDQIKMLQETLKYWLSVIRDEQLSIARNI